MLPKHARYQLRYTPTWEETNVLAGCGPLVKSWLIVVYYFYHPINFMTIGDLI